MDAFCDNEYVDFRLTMTYPVPFHRLTIYENANRFYIVGSDVNDTRYCLLKIDRTESRQLSFSNGDHEYTKKELNEILAMIHGGNASAAKNTCTSYVLTERIASAKGLLGFVRFMEGYYMMVITKASRVAQLGYHIIYKVEETEMIYIPSKTDGQQNNAEEQRYVKLFQSVDLATHFYFSYTYDLTRTLQDNISRPERTGFCEKYVWNSYLLEPMMENRVHTRWILPIIHGFMGSCALSIKGFTFNLLLLARRSNKYAGTRFLKRGANNMGYVANEVETEQIIYDASVLSFERGRFTSFVQLRGSVPLVWSQDLTKVVGKPPIQLDAIDPFAVIPALHFQDLRARYGDPIIVISLMKRRERRHQESVLNDEFRSCISYLNQFLDPRACILYLSFDMARCHKFGSVLPKLEEIGYNVLKLNGWFQTFPPLYFHEIRPPTILEPEGYRLEKPGRYILQIGVPRTNCVDCLDRTNVAQFIMGKVALSYQLYALGLLNEPRLGLETEICRILEALYEQHGDTLALQYAGSHLVHSIRTYKKISLFQERSRDVIQTLSRYYSNTFNDYDKQNAINLFLGIFRPSVWKEHLWDLYSDSALHNPFKDYDFAQIDYCAWFELPVDYWKSRTIECEWRTDQDATSQHHHHDEDEEKEKRLNDFDRYYRTFEMTSIDALVIRDQRDTVFIDSATSPPTLSAQPFMRLWKKQDSNGSKSKKSDDAKKEQKKPKSLGRVVEEANDPDDTSSEEEEEAVAAHSDTEIQYITPWNESPRPDLTENEKKPTNTKHCVNRTGVDFRLQSMKAVYGTEMGYPSKKDMIKYERYAELGRAYYAGEEDWDDRLDHQTDTRSIISPKESFHYHTLHALSIFTNDNSFGVAIPMLSESARQKYSNAVRCAMQGPKSPSSQDFRIYAEYARNYNSIVKGQRK